MNKKKKQNKKVTFEKRGKKPAIGIEPMTIALQMRCSNL